ncbi:MAG TPA: Holliday junction branch migration protein RuvA [Candidatus Scatosoma pullicola]|nr:Holliday junction branch migration protein RuvA [Candidatus Scatosoma pullicola]
MVAYLRGRVLTTTAETMIVDVNGVGYEVYCSGAAFAKAAVGGTAELYTHLQVKEDGITLFGFASPKEKEMFLRLISVPGVGPKLGIAVLSSMSGDDFAAAVATADVKRLSAVKGLGKKTAEKIVLELHGKISAAEVISAGGGELGGYAGGGEDRLSASDEDAVSALMGLGYNRADSVRAVRRAHDGGARSTEEVIMAALRSGV